MALVAPFLMAVVLFYCLAFSITIIAWLGQGANLLETRGRDVLSDRAIEVS
jgi:hypothetical protein